MQLKDKIAVVTGGASGIGAELSRRFAKEGARGVVVVDMNLAGAKGVAAEFGGIAIAAHVAKAEDIIRAVHDT